jgi:hypothetical protein
MKTRFAIFLAALIVAMSCFSSEVLDNGVSIVDTITIEEGQLWVDIPNAIPDGGGGWKVGSKNNAYKEAINWYKRSGHHLGKFDSVEHADAYAEQLHEDYAVGELADKYNPDHKACFVEPSWRPTNIYGRTLHVSGVNSCIVTVAVDGKNYTLDSRACRGRDCSGWTPKAGADYLTTITEQPTYTPACIETPVGWPARWVDNHLYKGTSQTPLPGIELPAIRTLWLNSGEISYDLPTERKAGAPPNGVEFVPRPAAGAPKPSAPALHAVVAQASLSIDSIPTGADIEIDGAFFGNTPSTITVSSGSHQVAVKKDGFAVWNKTLTVTGGTIRLNAEMVQEPPKQ